LDHISDTTFAISLVHENPLKANDNIL
jgi:hypothetical protein